MVLDNDRNDEEELRYKQVESSKILKPQIVSVGESVRERECVCERGAAQPRVVATAGKSELASKVCLCRFTVSGGSAS